MRRPGAWLLLILLGGTVLRVAQALSTGLWHDELFTTMIAAQPYHEFVAEFENDVHPPLHPFLFRFVLWPLSQTDWVLKSLHIGTYLGLAGVVAGMLRAAPRSHRFLIAFFGFVSFNAVHLYLSTELRMYGLLSLLMAASFLLLGLLATRQQRGLTWIIAGLLLLLNFTHYFGLVITASLLCGWFAVKGMGRRSLASALILVTPSVVGYLLYLPWFLTHLGNSSRVYYRGPVHLVEFFASLANTLPVTLFILGVVGILVIPAALRRLVPSLRERTAVLIASEGLLFVGIALLLAYPRFNQASFLFMIACASLFLAGRWLGSTAVASEPTASTEERVDLDLGVTLAAMALPGLVVLALVSVATLVLRGSSIHNFGSNVAFILYVAALAAYAVSRSPPLARAAMVAVFLVGSAPSLHGAVTDPQTFEDARLSYREIMSDWEAWLQRSGHNVGDVGTNGTAVATAERALNQYVVPVLERHGVELLPIDRRDPDFVRKAFALLEPGTEDRTHLWIITRHGNIIRQVVTEAEQRGFGWTRIGPGAVMIFRRVPPP